MCQVLKEIYTEVLDEQFHYDVLLERIKLQKIVYLLENIGVHVGNYSFTWNKYGPYSIALDDDAYRCSKKKEVQLVNFTEEAIEAFNQIKEMISKKIAYEDANWLECISSLHYLKYVLRFSTDDNKVMEELVKRKRYLNNCQENRIAMQIANNIEFGV